MSLFDFSLKIAKHLINTPHEVAIFCISLGADVIGLLLIVSICFLDRRQALVRRWQGRLFAH